MKCSFKKMLKECVYLLLFKNAQRRSIYCESVIIEKLASSLSLLR